jgi:uncharacterized membrane protein YgcG
MLTRFVVLFVYMEGRYICREIIVELFYLNQNQKVMTLNFAKVRALHYCSVFLLLLFVIQACRKNLDILVSPKSVAFEKHLLADKFFPIDDNNPLAVKKVANAISLRADKDKFITYVINEVGLPIWEKAFISNSSIQSNTNSLSETDNNDTSYVFIPIVPNGTKEVNGVFACSVTGDSVHINFLKEKDFRNYGFDNNQQYSADKLVGLMMFLQNKSFGATSFVVNDSRLFYGPAGDSSKKKIIRFKPNETNLSQSPAFNGQIETISIEICYMVWGPLCGDPLVCMTYGWTDQCETHIVWTNETVPSSGSGNGGGDGGNNGGGNSGEGGTSVQYLLTQMLGLTTSQENFLWTNWQFAEVIWNYIHTTDGAFTLTERRNNSIIHLNYLMTNSAYLQLSWEHYHYDPHGQLFPWFTQLSIEGLYPTLYSNIQALKLNPWHAFYLYNNPGINTQIKQFLDVNNNSITAKFRVKSSLDFALMGNPFEHPSTLLVDEIIDDNITKPRLRAVLNRITQPRFVNYASNLMRDINKSTQFRVALLQMYGPGPRLYANTVKLFGNYYTISLDYVNLPMCSQEFIAETIFHEFIHVEILSDPNWDFEHNSSHQLMLEKYTERLVTSLRNVFPNLPLKDAYAIVYSGFNPEDGRLTQAQKDDFAAAKLKLFQKIKNLFPSVTANELDLIVESYIEGGTKGTRVP